MRKIVQLLVLSALFVFVVALPAAAQQYPPAAGGAGRGAGGGGGEEFAFTGANTFPLLWLGLAALAAGTVLVVATRRRAAVRHTR